MRMSGRKERLALRKENISSTGREYHGDEDLLAFSYSSEVLRCL